MTARRLIVLDVDVWAREFRAAAAALRQRAQERRHKADEGDNVRAAFCDGLADDFERAFADQRAGEATGATT